MNPWFSHNPVKDLHHIKLQKIMRTYLSWLKAEGRDTPELRYSIMLFIILSLLLPLPMLHALTISHALILCTILNCIYNTWTVNSRHGCADAASIILQTMSENYLFTHLFFISFNYLTRSIFPCLLHRPSLEVPGRVSRQRRHTPGTPAPAQSCEAAACKQIL